MRNRDRALAILQYKGYDRLPIVHFGYWNETLEKWHSEGHVTTTEVETWKAWKDGSAADKSIGERLGFDFNWNTCYHPHIDLFPEFEEKVVETLPDGSRKVQNREGVIVLEKDDAVSIPTEIDHLLKTRQDWEKYYLPRLQFTEDRITTSTVNVNGEILLFYEGGFDFLKTTANREYPIGLYCGSLIGRIRNIVGLVGLSYLSVDDRALYEEMIDTVGELAYTCVEKVLATGAKFDFAHFWEDICFRGGPLVNPRVFREKVGPHYKRITDLLKQYGIEIVSVDCDGRIDALVPIWLENGVNIMFPIEVGTWKASIQPWRDQYGKELLGVGGMNKTLFSQDYAAIDTEIERLKPLVELGGYIPCPDHRIAPDAKWENVQYYCEKMRRTFGG